MGLKDFPGYRPQTSVLRTVDEPKRKKKFNWDRLFFLILLIGGTIYFVHNMYVKYGLIRVNGQVILEKMSVNFTDEIRIKKMLVDEGDEVKAGDTLFTYVVETANNNTFVNTFNKFDGSSNWFLRERLTAQRQLELKRSDRAGITALMELRQQEMEELKKRVYLGSELSHKIEPLKVEIQELRNQLAALDSEMRVIRRYLSALSQQEDQAMAQEQARIEAEIEARASFNNLILSYTTPITGLIGQIEKEENEVCYQSESVMTIHRLGEIKVKAYFPTEFADDIEVGDEVMLEFEDGTSSEGVIQNFYISTYPLPPEFQVRYEPVTRSIVADVVPKDEAGRNNWRLYYKMGVQVIKSRL